MIIKDNLTVFEGMTSISALIKAAETKPDTARKIEKIIYAKGNECNKYRQLAFLDVKSKSLGFKLEAVNSDEIDSVVTGKTHGGFIALCGERTYTSIDIDKIIRNGIYFLLEGIEDPYNFGYTLRSLYASGSDGVVLPKRNWMSVAGTVSRASAGCSELIDIFVDSPENAVNIFKASGFRICSANIRDSVLLYDADLTAPILFIIGGEKRGVSRALLDLTDFNVKIGYGREFSGSLPTAEASAIIAFEAAKYNKRIK